MGVVCSIICTRILRYFDRSYVWDQNIGTLYLCLTRETYGIIHGVSSPWVGVHLEVPTLAQLFNNFSQEHVTTIAAFVCRSPDLYQHSSLVAAYLVSTNSNVMFSSILRVVSPCTEFGFLYRVILSVLDPRKYEYLKDYSLDFEHAYMTTYLASWKACRY